MNIRHFLYYAPGRELDYYLAKALRYTEDAIALDASVTRCACCGDTDNLTMGYAGGNEVHLCPFCKRLEELS